MRLRTLTSEDTSFTFKLVHDLLPYDKRVAKILKSSSPNCKFCHDDAVEGDLINTFFLCRISSPVGSWIHDLVHNYIPLATFDDILKLNIDCNESLTRIVVQGLHYIWTNRCKNKPIGLLDFKAMMLSKVCLLKDTNMREIVTE